MEASLFTEDTLYLDYLSYLSWAIGAGLIVYGLVGRIRLFLILGLAVPSGMLAISASQKVTLKFDVVIINETGGQIEWRKVKQFVGGEYVFRDGSTMRISKPAGGPIGTVVVNDSDRDLQIIRVPYSSRPNLPGPGGWDVIATIRPGETGDSLERVEHFGPEDQGPPGSIQSYSSFDTLDWLAW